jgi:hypothetical protein
MRTGAPPAGFDGSLPCDTVTALDPLVTVIRKFPFSSNETFIGSSLADDVKHSVSAQSPGNSPTTACAPLGHRATVVQIIAKADTVNVNDFMAIPFSCRDGARRHAGRTAHATSELRLKNGSFKSAGSTSGSVGFHPNDAGIRKLKRNRLVLKTDTTIL